MIQDGKYRCIKSIKPVQWLCGFKRNKYYKISYHGSCAKIPFYEIVGEKPDERYGNFHLTESSIKEFFDLSTVKVGGRNGIKG